MVTIAAAVIAIVFWPVTLFVLAVMYWPYTLLLSCILVPLYLLGRLVKSLST